MWNFDFLEFLSINYLFLIMTLIYVIGCYFVSVIVKYYILKRNFKEFDEKEIKKAVWIANGIVYSLLGIFMITCEFLRISLIK